MRLESLWWATILRGAIAIIFGILAIVWPGVTVLALVLLFGVYAIVDGIFALIGAFTHRDARTGTRVLFGVLGLLGIAAGVIAFAWPGITALALAYVIAFWALLIGITEVIESFPSNHPNGRFGWAMFLSGLLAIALGVVILVHPGAGALGLLLLIGILAIAWGVVLVIAGIEMRSIGKRGEAEQGGGLGMPGGTPHPSGT